MKILVLNGPNLNMLGNRENDIYGNETYNDLKKMIKSYCKEKKIKVKVLQSNYEGQLTTWIQKFACSTYDYLIINPAAYTHYSYSIYDAIKLTTKPCVEVHISDINQREEFRKISLISKLCTKTICGMGLNGYIEAIKYLETLS